MKIFSKDFIYFVQNFYFHWIQMFIFILTNTLMWMQMYRRHANGPSSEQAEKRKITQPQLIQGGGILT